MLGGDERGAATGVGGKGAGLLATGGGGVDAGRETGGGAEGLGAAAVKAALASLAA